MSVGGMSILLLLIFLHSTASLRLERCPSNAVGLESGLIRDEQLSASSSFDHISVGPKNARLRTELASGGWCPKPLIHADSYEFIQVNLLSLHVITAVETQGRWGNGTGREFASGYMIDYLRADSGWVRYRNRTGHQLMSGNADTSSVVSRVLDPPIHADKIRIVPFSRQTRTVCMRIELIGCKQTDGLIYYSTQPEGSRLSDADFRDSRFEQTEEVTEEGARKGLGLLSDGFIADSDPFGGNNPNSSWIGWNNKPTGGAVVLLFEFAAARQLKEMTLHAYGPRIDGIEVMFSADGSHFPLSSQISSLDRRGGQGTGSYRLRVPLHSRLAKKLRVTLRFSSEWMFLTEVDFVSGDDELASSELDHWLPAIVSSDEDTVDDTVPFLVDVPLEAAETTTVASEPAAEEYGYSTLALLVLTLSLTVLTLLLCVAHCMRRGKKSEKIRPNPSHRQLIVHAGSQHSPAYHTYIAEDRHIYRLGSDKTDSTTLSSSKSKHSPPSWSDFNFPPPPDESDELIYAQPVYPPPPSTLGRRKKEDELHYATSDMFTTLAFDRIPKVSLAVLHMGPLLGEGKFTVVRECRLPDGRLAALKTVKEAGSEHARRTLLNELSCLHRARHPRVVSLLGRTEQPALITERMRGDVRAEMLQGRCSPSSCLPLLADGCAGLAHLESLGIVHGHLTPGNILVDAHGRGKISAPRGQSHHAQLRYSAPESILDNVWSSRSDTWSFAVCCWEVLDGFRRQPFDGWTNDQLIENAHRVLKGFNDQYLLDFSLLPACPPELRLVLRSAFNRHHIQRPAFSSLLPVFEQLAQPFD